MGGLMIKTKKVFAVCDLDEHYVVRLTSYLNQKKATPFEILAFTNPENLIRYAGQHPIEILLISRDAMNSKIRSLNVSRILILSEGEEPSFFSEGVRDIEQSSVIKEEDEGKVSQSPGRKLADGSDEASSASESSGLPVIYKYQSTESLTREVMNYYTGDLSSSFRTLRASGTEIYAVHSPIARCGKTLFSLTMAEILGEKKKTLYLNLENYSGFESLFGQTYRSDLTDLVYLSEKNGESLPIKLESVIQTLRNADYIPPAFFPGDLREIRSDEWISFLVQVSDLMDYKAVVLDIGNEPSDIPALLSACSHIYMPLLPDPLSRAKVFQYEKDMEALSMNRIMDRTVRLYLPEVRLKGSGMTLLDDLLKGPMGTYTRKLLKEEASQARSAAAPASQMPKDPAQYS